MITKKRKKHDGVKKIALLGTKSGVGVTHTGILLGEFLKEKMGASVAFVEKTHHGDIERLGEAVYGYSDTPFVFQGIDCYSISGEEKFKKKEQAYDYLILDFGTHKRKNRMELEQCEKKLVIGTLNLWEWKEYIRVAEYYKENLPKETLEYMVSLGDKKLLPRVEKQLRSKVHFLGPQPIEKALSKEAVDFFGTLV